MFGQISIDSIEIKYPAKELDRIVPNNHQGQRHATSVVEGVGMFLFALYHVAIIIVLINMLIAMMSHSFEAIQVRRRPVRYADKRTSLAYNEMLSAVNKV